MLIQPNIFKQFPKISAGQSTRLGGVSPLPYFSLNLGKSVGDNFENVEKNRELFFDQLGFEKENTIFSHQVHGCEILLVKKAGNYSGFDAQITNISGICLAISIADCTPILIYDAKKNVVAAIHAGWKGTVAEIVSRTLDKLNENFGTKGENCFVYIGACISQHNFEVGADVANHFDSLFKYFVSDKNRYFVDLKAANKAQLINFGVPENQIEVTDLCTVANNNLFFSHRKEKGLTGRGLAAIGIIQN